MKNVLLIGDSIRLGYEDRLKELLGKNVTVFAPGENCRYTKYALWGISWWMAEFGSPKLDAVHFNAGIWDLHRCTADRAIFTPIDEYVIYQRRLARQLKSYTPNVICANITPGGKGLDKEEAKINALINTEPDAAPIHLATGMEEWNADVVRYNAAMETVMKEEDVRMNDFHSAILADPEKYLSDDGIHMTPDGYDLLAHLAAEKIFALL